MKVSSWKALQARKFALPEDVLNMNPDKYNYFGNVVDQRISTPGMCPGGIDIERLKE